MTLFAFWPSAWIELGPVVPALLRWKRGEMAAARAWVEGFVVWIIFSHRLHGFLCEWHGLSRLHVSVLEEHESDQGERRASDSYLCAHNAEHCEQRQQTPYQ